MIQVHKNFYHVNVTESLQLNSVELFKQIMTTQMIQL